MDAITPPVKERPIIFSAAMVRAILEGRKTQTRHVVQPTPVWTPVNQGDWWQWKFKDGFISGRSEWFCERAPSHCPYGQPGDRLWVRETVKADNELTETITAAKYVADGAPVLYQGPEVDEEGEDDYGGSLAHWWYSKDTAHPSTCRAGQAASR